MLRSFQLRCPASLNCACYPIAHSAVASFTRCHHNCRKLIPSDISVIWREWYLASTFSIITQFNVQSHCKYQRYHNDHDDVIKWRHFPRHWPFVRGIYGRQWIPLTKTSDADLWCFLWFKQAWINHWVNNGEAGDLRRHQAHHDVTVTTALRCMQKHRESPVKALRLVCRSGQFWTF